MTNATDALRAREASVADTTIQAAMDWLVWIAGDKPEVRTIRDRIAALEAEVARLQSTSERLTVLCCEQVTRAETAEAEAARLREDATATASRTVAARCSAFTTAT